MNLIRIAEAARLFWHKDVVRRIFGASTVIRALPELATQR
jgi:hypothetical protein